MEPEVQTHKLKILVVEDDPLNLKLMELMLGKLNIEMLAARDAEEALDLLKKVKADLMLFDIALGPGMSGVNLMQKVREREEYIEIPIIAVTAYTYSEIEEFVNDHGFNQYMGKPISFQQLKDTIEQIDTAAIS